MYIFEMVKRVLLLNLLQISLVDLYTYLTKKKWREKNMMWTFEVINSVPNNLKPTQISVDFYDVYRPRLHCSLYFPLLAVFLRWYKRLCTHFVYLLPFFALNHLQILFSKKLTSQMRYRLYRTFVEQFLRWMTFYMAS